MLVNKLKELRNGGDEEGFTLIELMIVVVIIGILAAIAIPIFTAQQKNAINAGVKSDVRNTVTNVATALVKNPTAAYVSGSATGANGTFIAGASSTDTNTGVIVVSDSATTVKVGGAITSTGGANPTTTQAASGAWNTYTVVGNNTGTGATFSYDSQTGKTVQS